MTRALEHGPHYFAFFGVTMLLPLGNDVELHLFRQN